MNKLNESANRVSERGHARPVALKNLERNLPLLSSSVSRLMTIPNGDPQYYESVLDCVATDPGLAAELFKFARSPLFRGLDDEVELSKCLTRVGATRFTTLVLASSVHTLLRVEQPVFVSLWKHSLWTGALARALAAQNKRFEVAPDWALCLGMLHNLGAFALAKADPEYYALALDRCATDSDALLVAERNRYGTTHPEVGAVMAERWCLPSSARTIITLHHSHDAVRAAGSTDPLILIHLAAAVGDLMVASADQAPVLLDAIQEALKSFELRSTHEWDVARVLRIARDCKTDVESYSQCLAA
ncbi:MAG: HDOD domain-containing protein [Planctomycetota bacterium]|nr:MAG: HDOD domain-containing protein [Planctomycetota bacterium]